MDNYTIVSKLLVVNELLTFKIQSYIKLIKIK